MVIAGILYGGLVFALGFVLGTVRILATPADLGPADLGPVVPVLIELPVMLAASWLVCGRLMRRWPRMGAWQAVGMGLVGLLTVLVGELLVARLLLGLDWPGVWAQYRTAPAQIGLAAQVIFAAFPWLRWRLAARQGH